MRIPLYHIVAVNQKSGRRYRMTGYAMPLQSCRVMLRKISNHPARRLELERI